MKEFISTLKKNIHFLLIVILFSTCFFIGPRGNLYEWLKILFIDGLDIAFNNPKVDWYSDNNILLNFIILLIIPSLLWFTQKKPPVKSLLIIIVFNLWMISINCFCPHNDGYLIDGGDCFIDFEGYGKRVHVSALNNNNGRIHPKGGSTYWTGVAYDNWTNGNIKLEAHFHIGYLNGFHREWNKAGQIIEEKYYYWNSLAGPSKKWYPNGNLKFEKFYKWNGHGEDPILISAECWNEDGNLIECD